MTDHNNQGPCGPQDQARIGIHEDDGLLALFETVRFEKGRRQIGLRLSPQSLDVLESAVQLTGLDRRALVEVAICHTLGPLTTEEGKKRWRKLSSSKTT
jgi:hypothetical protein